MGKNQATIYFRYELIDNGRELQCFFHVLWLDAMNSRLDRTKAHDGWTDQSILSSYNLPAFYPSQPYRARTAAALICGFEIYRYRSHCPASVGKAQAYLQLRLPFNARLRVEASPFPILP